MLIQVWLRVQTNSSLSSSGTYLHKHILNEMPNIDMSVSDSRPTERLAPLHLSSVTKAL